MSTVMTEAPPLRVSPNFGPTLTVQREYGRDPNSTLGADFNGRWVVRDSEGTYKEHSLFLGGLEARWPGLRVIDRDRHD